tara:strand:- start:2437 stop:3039 length:603 start_codon:yes stop_codon:yes gene_type:complete
MNKILLPQSYHNFSDKRTILGIPNGINVLSNIVFIFLAIYLLQKKKSNLLSIYLILLAIASSYYHLNPSDDTLFWDVLMIATTSMIIFTMMSGTKNGELFYLFGILSVIYWKMTGDLRLYLVILIGMPLYIALKYYENKKVKNDVILLLFFYLLCRIVEHNDHFIYKITNNTISGHTLKHIFAGLSIYYTIKLLEKINLI